MKRKLQVFISSTFTDLIKERQAAVGAVLKAGHIPAGMELFTAGDRSQMVTIKEWIDASDVYMLILGGRYGSVETASGVGYTELEYDYAVEQGKPVFAVVITEEALEANIKESGSAFMEKKNPKELALFRTKVLSNISSFFEDCKDIKLCVHESLADFSSNRNLKGWISGDEIVDTKPLFEEIKKLSEENQSLRETLDSMEKRLVTKVVSKQEDKKKIYTELIEILSNITIKIPDNIKLGNEKELDLWILFQLFQDDLVRGVRNSMASSELERFLYFNLCPKLQIHGLVVNEKVPNVAFRRSSASSLGIELFAYVEKENLRVKKETSSKKTSSDIQTAQSKSQKNKKAKEES